MFVRINNYRGAERQYTLADGKINEFHFDFFNGWQEGKLQEIIDTCDPLPGEDPTDYNPPCHCDHLLTETANPSGEMCEIDVKELILDEPTDNLASSLPRGTCNGPSLVAKSWQNDPPLDCAVTPTSPTTPAPVSTTPQPTLAPTSPTTPAPVLTTLQPTPQPTTNPTPSPSSSPQEADCTEVCCFDSHNACLAAADIVCSERRLEHRHHRSLGPDHCAIECDELEEEGEIETFEWDDCYLECHDSIFGETDCFDEEELKCIPCEEVDCEAECDVLLEEEEIDEEEWEDCVDECD